MEKPACNTTTTTTWITKGIIQQQQQQRGRSIYIQKRKRIRKKKKKKKKEEDPKRKYVSNIYTGGSEGAGEWRGVRLPLRIHKMKKNYVRDMCTYKLKIRFSLHEGCVVVVVVVVTLLLLLLFSGTKRTRVHNTMYINPTKRK